MRLWNVRQWKVRNVLFLRSHLAPPVFQVLFKRLQRSLVDNLSLIYRGMHAVRTKVHLKFELQFGCVVVTCVEQLLTDLKKLIALATLKILQDVFLLLLVLCLAVLHHATHWLSALAAVNVGQADFGEGFLSAQGFDGASVAVAREVLLDNVEDLVVSGLELGLLWVGLVAFIARDGRNVLGTGLWQLVWAGRLWFAWSTGWLFERHCLWAGGLFVHEDRVGSMM